MQADDHTIARTLGGEREAFRQVVLRYQGPLFSYVGKLLRHSAEVEDVVQDVFCSAFARLSTYDSSRGRFSTWLFSVARNRCFNHLAAQRHRQHPTLSAARDVPAVGPSPGDNAATKELFAALDHKLNQLPDEQRSAFILAVLQNVPLAEVAAIEGVSLGTVKSRINRARVKLRTELDPAPKERPS